MRKFKILTAAFLLGFVALNAQQEAHYTQFMYNKQLLNPGFAGSRRIASVSALYRTQWVGYEGHPQSYLATYDDVFDKNRLGVGIVLQHQTEGIINRNAANLALSYDLINTEETTLRIGLSGALRQYRFDLQNPDVYIKDRNDVTLSQEATPSFTNANIGAGIYFDNKTYYVGVSVPNLMKNALILNPNATYNSSAQESRHIYVMAGGFFKFLGNKDLHLKPSIMYKYVSNAPFSLDANLSVMFKKKFSVGLSYRFGGKFSFGDSISGGGDSVDLLAFFQVNEQLGIGVAYDYTLSELRQYTKGSYEIMMRYDFVPDAKRIMHNPRYFF